jgi:uncharacterized protein
MLNHQLSPDTLNVLLDVLAPFSDRIESVALFGSRATGKATANSDVDIVLYGAIDEPLVDRLWTLLDESRLPLKVDVVAYSSIPYAPLRQHIDEVGKTLFSRSELAAHRVAG